jgi:hypothetical protein
MNRLNVEKKIEDLSYKMNIAKIAIDKASYNLKYTEQLGLSKADIERQHGIINNFSAKYNKNKNTYDVLEEYLKGNLGSNDSELLFKCTFPAEEGYINDSYQTAIICKENVAKLFANGVNYKDIVYCLDNSDVLGVDTTFDVAETNNLANGNVDVELANGIENMDPLDVPINCQNRIIASGKIPYCISIDENEINNLSGEKYDIPVPSFEDISFLRDMTNEKFLDLENKVELEQVVKYKMDTAIRRMNSVLDDVEKYNER